MREDGLHLDATGARKPPIAPIASGVTAQDECQGNTKLAHDKLLLYHKIDHESFVHEFCVKLRMPRLRL
jgi:hypothetical protein